MVGEVPKNKLSTGPVAVTVNGKTASSSARFVYVPTATAVTTVAGHKGGPIDAMGFADGHTKTARFFRPSGLTVDGAGNVYVADTLNQRIRKILPDGEVVTLAGSAQPGADGAMQPGFADGEGTTQALFHFPVGMAIDAQGNLYVADTYNHRIRKISPQGVVSTFAGGEKGLVDGEGATARFYMPADVAIDAKGNLYVADAWNHRIRKLTLEGNEVVVSTFAGNGTTGHKQGAHSDGSREEARLDEPIGITIDAKGNLYVADASGNRIRKVTPEGEVSTLGGEGEEEAALFAFPSSIAIDAVGNLYVTDTYNHRIRMVTPSGSVLTLAGSGKVGGEDGPADTAQFIAPWGIAIDAAGHLYVADTGNHRIRKIVLE